jgi:hypothetical protein
MGLADLGCKVYVTRGELATIVGIFEYGDAISALMVPDMTMAQGAVKGQSVLNVLGENYGTKGIYLDNPDVVAMFDLLAYEGVISTSARQKIVDFTAAALIEETPPEAANPYAHSYRVPLPADPNPIVWVSQFMTADYSAWVEGAWLMVNTNGACTAPGTEVV